eukprot:1532719-Pyramimonas_sp.AAC.1
MGCFPKTIYTLFFPSSTEYMCRGAPARTLDDGLCSWSGSSEPRTTRDLIFRRVAEMQILDALWLCHSSFRKAVFSQTSFPISDCRTPTKACFIY